MYMSKPVRFIQVLTGAAALLAVSINSSVGCGGYGGFGRGVFIPDPGSDVTDQLVVQEGWSRQPLKPSEATSAPLGSEAVESALAKAKSQKQSGASRAAGVEPRSARTKAQFTKVKTLTIAGPWGAEVSIERSLDGVDWEIAEVLFIDDEDSILWTETRCEGSACENYQYRCTAYSWNFDDYGAYDDYYDYW